MNQTPTDETVLALEVGAARMTAAVVDRSGFVRLSRHRATPIGTETALGELIELATQVRAQAGSDVAAVGVAVPADVDAASGIVRHSGELGWHNVPLGDAFHRALGLSVLVDRSVRAAALAEGRFGAAAGVRDWLYVSIDSDIQAAATVSGSLQRGATGGAGEIGHFPIYPFGLVCRCGQRGCANPYAGATAIRRRYRELADHDASIPQIAARVGRDPMVDEVWHQACAALALALATYTLIQDPELIVLSGEVAAAGGALLSAVGAELRDRLAWRQPPRLLLGTAATPVLRGAALLAWSAL